MRMLLNYYGMIREEIDFYNVIAISTKHVCNNISHLNYMLDQYAIAIGVIYVVFVIKLIITTEFIHTL